MKRIVIKVITIAIAISMLMLVACTPEPVYKTPPEYESVRVLLWEDELGMYTYDDVASPEFEQDVPVWYMEANEGWYQMPWMYLVTYTREVGSSEYTVSEERIDLYEFREAFDYEGLDKVYISGYHIGVNDRADPLVNDTITMIYRPDPSLRRVFNIRMDPIPETGVVLSMDDDNTIESGSQRTVWAAVMPDDASFKNVKFEIYSIVLPSGEVVDTAREIAKYASLDRQIDQSTGLITTSAIRVGSKIRLRATTEYKEIESEILDIEVVPTRVESLVIVSGGLIVLPDSELNFGIKVGPSNATALIDGVKPTAVVDGSTPYGYITGDYNKGFVLHVSDDAPPYSNILINLMIQDGEDLFMQSFSIFVRIEPLLGLAVYSNGIELSTDINYIDNGVSLPLQVIKIPDNATDNNVVILAAANKYYAYIDKDNNLIVTEDAPQGYSFVVNASGDHIQSPAYRFVVR